MLRANLRGVVADATDFTQANMREVDLHGAALRQSIFFLADLGVADLSAADLSYAVLRSANLTNANQAGAILTGAMMPDNTIHP
jgi:uncharacterized protein YjbI with pentapeptide repeats